MNSEGVSALWAPSFHLRSLFQLCFHLSGRGAIQFALDAVSCEGFLPVETKQEIFPELGCLGVETASPGDRLMSLKDPHSPCLLPSVIYFCPRRLGHPPKYIPDSWDCYWKTQYLPWVSLIGNKGANSLWLRSIHSSLEGVNKTIFSNDQKLKEDYSKGINLLDFLAIIEILL